MTSGRSSLNGLPDGWQATTLDACVANDAPICYGILKPGKNVEGGIPVVKVRDLVRGRVRVEELLRTHPSIDRAYARSRLREGDLLLSIRGTAGTVARVPRELDGANITQDTARIRVRHDVNRRFLENVLRASDAQAFIRFHTVGQAVKGINIRDVRRIAVALPPLDEQDQIEEVLERLDAGVHRVVALLLAKRRFKRGLTQQLLTGKRRFNACGASTETKPTAFGSIPSSWAYPRMDEIAQEVTQRAGTGFAEFPVVSCSKHRGLVDSEEYFGKRVFSSDRGNYKVVRAGQFAYPSNHLEEGSIGLLQHRNVAVVSPIYTVFETSDQVVPDFLYALFKTDQSRQLFAARTNASVNRRGSMRWKQFGALRVPLPPRPEQGQVASILAELEREINLLDRLRDALDTQRRGVAELLLTGKVRVPA